jgi:hypothetical protein
MTHPQFRIDTLHERSRELANRIERTRLLADEPTREEVADETVSLRLCRVSDDPILERLAAFEGRRAPQDRHLIAEVDGEAVAALSLASGEILADPFRPTAYLLPLMRRRAAQLGARPRPRWALDVLNHRFAHTRTTTR